jgi:hypothetical protein
LVSGRARSKRQIIPLKDGKDRSRIKRKTAYIKKTTKAFIAELDGNHRKLPYVVPYYLSMAYEEGRNSIFDKLTEITNEPMNKAIEKIKKAVKGTKPNKRP